MQTIAGIHYNFSMPDAFWDSAWRHDGSVGNRQDYITERYLGLIRNFQRYSGLLIYLFGASPAVCKSFLRDQREHHLQAFDEHSNSMYLPHATALRMGDLGYQSDAQQHLKVCYNKLESYIETLHEAITRSHPDYEAIGTGSGDNRRQLNTSLLQIENEFYSPIRPKRVIRPGEVPLGALRRAGVEYIEVRCVDVNPFQPLGIDGEQMRFLDTFLLYCLLQDSPDCNDEERDLMAENIHRVVERGREPGLQLLTPGGEAPLTELAGGLLADMAPIAELLNSANDNTLYSQSLGRQQAKVDDPSQTPSAQILTAMEEENLPFFRLAMGYSEKWAEQFRSNPLSPQKMQHFEQASKESLRKQMDMEAADEVDFDEFLASYYRQYEQLR